MALIVCQDCGKKFSDAAPACPNCGRPNRAAPAPAAATPPAVKAKTNPGCFPIGCGIVVVLWIIGYAVGGNNSSSSSVTGSTASSQTSSSTSSSTQAGSSTTPSGMHITKSGYMYCLTVDGFNELTDYLVKEDKEAAAQMVAGGDCGFLPGGMEVDVTDTKILSGMVQIRKKGSRITFWTNLEAI